MAKIPFTQSQNIVLLCGVAICSSIAILGLSTIDRLGNLGQSRQEEQYLERLKLFSNDIRARLDGLSTVTLLKADHLSSHQIDGRIGEIDSELEQLRQLLPKLRTMIVINPEGIVVDDMREGKPGVNIDVSERKYFQFHLQEKTDEIRVFPPVVSRVDRTLTWVMSAAARDRSGKLLAVVASSFDRRFFSDIFAPQDQTDQGVGLLIQQDGYVLEASPSQANLIGQPLDFLPPKSIGNEWSILRNYDWVANHRRGTLLHTTVKGWPLELVFFLDETMIDTARKQNIGATPYWILVLLLAIVLSTAFLYINICKMLIVEKQLRLSQEKLLQAQYIAGVGDFTWDIDSGKVEWSQGAYRLLNYPATEEITLDRVLREIHHPDDNELVMQWLNAGMQAGKTDLGSLEYRLLSWSVDAPIAKSEGFPVHPVTLSRRLSPNRQWVVCPRA